MRWNDLEEKEFGISVFFLDSAPRIWNAQVYTTGDSNVVVVIGCCLDHFEQLIINEETCHPVEQSV